jgi:hypothetical protein
MAYLIKKQNSYEYSVIDTLTDKIIGKDLDMYEANELSWLEKILQSDIKFLPILFLVSRNLPGIPKRAISLFQILIRPLKRLDLK